MWDIIVEFMAKRRSKEVTESPPLWLCVEAQRYWLPGSHGHSFFKILNLMSVPIMNSLLAVFLEYLLSVALLQMYSSWLSLDGIIILSQSIHRILEDGMDYPSTWFISSGLHKQCEFSCGQNCLSDFHSALTDWKG